MNISIFIKPFSIQLQESSSFCVFSTSCDRVKTSLKGRQNVVVAGNGRMEKFVICCCGKLSEILRSFMAVDDEMDCRACFRLKVKVRNLKPLMFPFISYSNKFVFAMFSFLKNKFEI
jgi:hypothetical protein